MPRWSGSGPVQYSLLEIPDRRPKFISHLHFLPVPHYDLRFELGKVLADFALPEGISSELGVKKRAIRMEDHPKSLLRVTARTKSGPGAEMDLDDLGEILPVGRSEPYIDDQIRAGLDEGYLVFEIFGRKLNGKYLLQKEDTDWSLTKISSAIDQSNQLAA